MQQVAHIVLDKFKPRLVQLTETNQLSIIGSKIQPKDRKMASFFYGSSNHAYRHGMHGTPTYKIWGGMLSRCYNRKVRIYKYYGGRGITVCERWKDFRNFYEDMGERPNGMQVDRIDNDKGYSPDNCRWATAKENNPSNKGTLIDSMPGRMFGKWTVMERVKHKPNHRYYLCRCECGFERIICGGELRRERTTRCRSCKNKEHGDKHRGWSERRKK